MTSYENARAEWLDKQMDRPFCLCVPFVVVSFLLVFLNTFNGMMYVLFTKLICGGTCNIYFDQSKTFAVTTFSISVHYDGRIWRNDSGCLIFVLFCFLCFLFLTRQCNVTEILTSSLMRLFFR